MSAARAARMLETADVEPAFGRWTRIDYTMPANGVEVLCWIPESPCPMRICYWSTAQHDWYEEGGGYLALGGLELPTHWMPLPEGPTR